MINNASYNFTSEAPGLGSIRYDNIVLNKAAAEIMKPDDSTGNCCGECNLIISDGINGQLLALNYSMPPDCQRQEMSMEVQASLRLVEFIESKLHLLRFAVFGHNATFQVGKHELRVNLHSAECMLV